MNIKQIYTKCLAQGSYFIESNGEAIVIDPLRETEPYIALAAEYNAKIKYVFETHFHADFVSGHVSLGEKVNAPVVFGPNANPSFDSITAVDEQEFKIGNCTLKVLHTPGHTLESSCYLLLDEENEPHAIFTGDTLFLGDVGRPDLAQKTGSITQEDLAGMLYDSIRTKIFPLPDDLIIYPGHGAGSACGKSMSKETVGTLGDQKVNNYALRVDMTKEEFISEVTDGLTPPPAYFPQNVQLNKEGYKHLSDIIEDNKQYLSVSDFKEKMNHKDVTVLDVRHQKDFIKAHVPGSIFIGIDGGFAPWVGAIIKDVNTPLLLVTPEGREKETITRLSRVGFDNVIGILKDGVSAWKNAGENLASIETISAEDIADKVKNNENPEIVDVRKPGEYESSHWETAQHIPLSNLAQNTDYFSSNKTYHMHCAGGYRSVIGNSILKANGIHNVIDILGGYGAMKKTDVPQREVACSSGS